MPDVNLLAIRKRVNAANQTRKITHTMELIASSRLQQSKAQLAHHQVWLQHMREAAGCLADRYFEPLEQRWARRQNAYIVFGGSKGLSGSYSPSLLQYADAAAAGHPVVAVGSAAEAFYPDAHSLLGDEPPSADYAQTIAHAALTLYESREVDAVYLIYTKGSRHMKEPLLPLTRVRAEQNVGVVVEPSARRLYPALYRAYVQAIVHEAHLQAFLAEQIARVSAMNNATENADKIVEGLQAAYNRIRQAAITQEILIVSNAAR